MTLINTSVFCLTLFFGYTCTLIEGGIDNGQSERVYYFAYGSNMLKKRMMSHVENAVWRGPAVLKDYRLDFDTPVAYWNGAVATATEEPGAEVWGVLWSMGEADAKDFSSSQNKSSKFYAERYVKVHTPNRGEYDAFTHVAKVRPRKLPPWIPLPIERRPSATYHKVLVTAATENGLPQKYVEQLIGIPHNNNEAKQVARRSLNLPDDNSSEEVKYTFKMKWSLK